MTSILNELRSRLEIIIKFKYKTQPFDVNTNLRGIVIQDNVRFFALESDVWELQILSLNIYLEAIDLFPAVVMIWLQFVSL